MHNFEVLLFKIKFTSNFIKFEYTSNINRRIRSGGGVIKNEKRIARVEIRFDYLTVIFCKQNFQEWWKIIKNREEVRVQKYLISISCVLRTVANVGLVIFDVPRSSSPYR